MAPSDRQPIDRDPSNAVKVIRRRAKALGLGMLIELRHRVTAHAEPRDHLLDRQHLRELPDRLRELGGHSLTAIEPGHRLDGRRTARAL
jgi:hypothetical protein